MRTTLNIEDSLMRKLKRQAREQGRTLTDIFEEALRLYTQPREERAPRFVWSPEVTDAEPSRGVDFSDRDALYRAMEREP
jgi:hypothetical protein